MIWNWLYQLRLTSRVSFQHEWWMFIIVWAELNWLLRDECFFFLWFFIFLLYLIEIGIFELRWSHISCFYWIYCVFKIEMKIYRSKVTNIRIHVRLLVDFLSLIVTPATEHIICHRIIWGAQILQCLLYTLINYYKRLLNLNHFKIFLSLVLVKFRKI